MKYTNYKIKMTKEQSFLKQNKNGKKINTIIIYK